MQQILIKITETMVPDYTVTFNVKEKEFISVFENFLQSMPAPIPRLFVILLNFINFYTVFFKFKKFENLERDERRKILEGWAGSKLYVRRAIFSMLKTFVLLVFYSTENAEKACGYERKCVLD